MVMPIKQKAHDAVTKYMTAVVEDESADNTQARRDAFAMALAKHLVTDPTSKRPTKTMVAAAKAAAKAAQPPKEPREKKAPALGKKEAATVAAKTAGEGTPWAGILRPASGEPNAQEPAAMDS